MTRFLASRLAPVSRDRRVLMHNDVYGQVKTMVFFLGKKFKKLSE